MSDDKAPAEQAGLADALLLMPSSLGQLAVWGVFLVVGILVLVVWESSGSAHAFWLLLPGVAFTLAFDGYHRQCPRCGVWFGRAVEDKRFTGHETISHTLPSGEIEYEQASAYDLKCVCARCDHKWSTREVGRA